MENITQCLSGISLPFVCALGSPFMLVLDAFPQTKTTPIWGSFLGYLWILNWQHNYLSCWMALYRARNDMLLQYCITSKLLDHFGVSKDPRLSKRGSRTDAGVVSRTKLGRKKYLIVILPWTFGLFRYTEVVVNIFLVFAWLGLGYLFLSNCLNWFHSV